ncbi:MAG: hypothetical protein HQL06_10485 [Nitrospirae bacterium]|nr:hypothetical protein [Nitrospirota bacterium]
MSSVAVVAIAATPVLSPFLILAAGTGTAAVASQIALRLYNIYKGAKKDSQRAELVASIRDNIKNTVNEIRLEIDNLHTEDRTRLLDRLRNIEDFDHRLQYANTQQSVQEAVIRFGDQYSILKSDIELIKIEQAQTQKIVQKLVGEITLQILTIKQSIDPSYTPEDIDILQMELESALKLDTLDRQLQWIRDIQVRLSNVITTARIRQTADKSQLKEEKYQRGSRFADSPDKNTNNQVDVEDIWGEEARQFYSQIKELDEEYYHRLTPLIKELNYKPNSQRLQLIRTSMKLYYGQIKELTANTNIFKDMLKKLLQQASKYEGFADISPSIELLFMNRYVRKDQYDSSVAILSEFIIDAEERMAKQKIILRLKENIESLGYPILTDKEPETLDNIVLASDLFSRIESEQVVYLDTQWEDYKVLLRLNNYGELTTRLIRVVKTQKERQNLPTNQRQKDREIAMKWCEVYDRFIEKLREDYPSLIQKLRKEPQDENLTYVVNKELLPSGRTSKQKTQVHSELGTRQT